VSLAFSPNNAYIASGGADGTVRLWNARGPKQDPVTLQHRDRAVFLDSSGNGRPVVDFSGSVGALSFSQDSQFLASGTMEFVRVWTTLRPATSPLSFPLVPGSDIVFGGWVQGLGFSPDNRMLTAFLIDDSTTSVKRWDLRSAQSQTILKLTGDGAVARSDDWSRVASAQADGSIQVWDLRRPTRPELSLWPAGPTGNIPAEDIEIAKAIAFSQRGDLIASIGRNETVRVWKLENPKAPIMTLPGPGFGFVAFAFEDTRLVVRGMDAVRMWDLREPDAPPVVFGNLEFPTTAVSRDGAYLALGDSDGNIWVWPLWEAAADQLCARVTRNLSLKEWRFYVGKSIPYERTCPALPAGTGAH
jgi:WD40 repeat protein